MKVTTTQRTDRGRVRPTNQDAVYCGVDPDGRRGHLLILADGMGGARAGEIASRIAVESVAECYWASAAPAARALCDAVVEANRRVFRASQAPETNGMGTTCSALALLGTSAYLAHVGDSRIYHLRGDDLRRLTRSHSLWAEQVERGAVSPAVRAGQNVLTRVVGVPEEIEVDVVDGLPLCDGDRFLLCSDGLWGLITDPELGTNVRGRSLEDSCQALVGLAIDRGAPDNLSVILAELRA